MEHDECKNMRAQVERVGNKLSAMQSGTARACKEIALMKHIRLDATR